MQAKPYLITFTPIESFFFGGSESFSEGYIAESLKYPQPTTILGCLRFSILESKGLLMLDEEKGRRFPDENKKAEYQKLTGSSYAAGLNEEDGDLGIIEKLSPVFIVKFDMKKSKPLSFLFPSPSDLVYKLDEEDKICGFKACSYIKNDKGLAFVRGAKKSFAVKTNRDIKAKKANYLGDEDFWKNYLAGKIPDYKEYLTEEKIFLRDSQTGIGRDWIKDEAGQHVSKYKTAEDEKLYVKYHYKLTKGFAFGVICHLKDEIHFPKDANVVLGGERSKFKMKAHPIEMNLKNICRSNPLIRRMIEIEDSGDLFSECGDTQKLVLISPLIMQNNQSAFTLEHAIIPGMLSMRMLGDKDYKTDSYRLIPNGSVLFPESDFEVSNEQYTFAAQIGYNRALKAIGF